MKKRREGFYSISVVAKMFSVHQQTVRLYEKEGLISPKRSAGNTRLFSEEDVDRLEEIIYLTHKLGVNLAGVEVIMGLQKKINKLQNEINKLFAQAQDQLKEEGETFKETAKKQAKRLVEIKKKSLQRGDAEAQTTLPIDPVDVEIVDDWKVDYEEENE
ncbi:MerR family transcriptional regulator [Candidatus Dependentiae bacterium]|nr:MerR family transcriptional regulator [Candidatus Dependentiae bacterium]